MVARRVAPSAETTEYTTVFSIHRAKMPPRIVNSVCRLSHSENSPPNHRPKVEKRAELSFVDDTNSHHRGRMKYSTHTQSSTVSSRLRRREGS